MSDTATLYLIRRAVCAHYKITNADLVGRSCARSIAWPRQVAMMLAREMTAMSLPMIGRRFNRDHTSVLHAVRAVHARAVKNLHYAEQVEGLRANIRSAAEDQSFAGLSETISAVEAVAQFLGALEWPPPPKPVQYRWGRAYRPLCLDRASAKVAVSLE